MNRTDPRVCRRPVGSRKFGLQSSIVGKAAATVERVKKDRAAGVEGAVQSKREVAGRVCRECHLCGFCGASKGIAESIRIRATH